MAKFWNFLIHEYLGFEKKIKAIEDPEVNISGEGLIQAADYDKTLVVFA
ncbi:MAG: hypothetical protein ABIA74_01315 [bacterium]